MSMQKILIADDETPARARLRRLVEDLDGYQVVGEAGHGREVLQACTELQPDVVLMDIRMPDMDGIEAARHLSKMDQGPAVIFTTAFDSYAIEAFDAQAIGYLLKPVRRERLQRALRQAARLSAQVIEGMATPRAARRNLCVRKPAGLQLIDVDSVSHFQADQKYVTVFHDGGEDLLDEPLKDLAEEFSDRFIRIHRSVLVSARHLDRLEKTAAGPQQVWLRGRDEPLPVSRRHITDVKLALRKPAS
ncbi:MAG: LytR/AlgR family response regulator transcription factor [Gammaproteobacteria bacterium]